MTRGVVADLVSQSVARSRSGVPSVVDIDHFGASTTALYIRIHVLVWRKDKAQVTVIAG